MTFDLLQPGDPSNAVSSGPIPQPREKAPVGPRRGKWSVAGVPHRGWICVAVEDIGEPKAECEMCEKQKIRYIHYMQHPDYPDVLEVGSTCAGNMEGSLSSSRAREASIKLQSKAAPRSGSAG